MHPAMNAYSAPIAFKPSSYPSSSTSFFNGNSPLVLSPPMSLTASTPSLAPRSLTSSPSTSAQTSEDEIYRSDDLLHTANLGLESFTFDTEDDANLTWYTGKTLLKQPQQAASSSSTPSPERPLRQPVPSTHIPNPHAVPYIATVVRNRALADLGNRGRVDNTWRIHHGWLRHFRTGSVANWSGHRKYSARQLVAAGPWDTALISELAAKFIERVAEGRSESSPSVPLFVMDVYEAFHEWSGNDALAETFSHQLRQCLLCEFRAWWLPALPTAIRHLSKYEPSPLRNISPQRYLSSALSVAEFAGDLFAQSLTKPHYLRLFLSMILDGLSILEEVAALHAVLSHAGERTNRHLQLTDFLGTLRCRAAKIGPGASVLGHPDVPSEVRRLIQDIESMASAWDSARATSSPSVCSDSLSEYSDHNPDFVDLTSNPGLSFTTRIVDEAIETVPAVPPGLAPPAKLEEPSETYRHEVCADTSQPEEQLPTMSDSRVEEDEDLSPPTIHPDVQGSVPQSRSWADIVKT